MLRVKLYFGVLLGDNYIESFHTKPGSNNEQKLQDNKLGKIMRGEYEIDSKLTSEFKFTGSLRLTLFSSVSVFLKEKGRREVLRSAGAQNNSLLYNLDQDY